jgi:RimJ/RimL family protein N-acetyltransferase
MTPEIVQISQEYVESFHRALDFVARERRYLAFLEAPPLDDVKAFARSNIAKGYPQLIVLSAGEVVGWCDVVPKPRPVHAHVGGLGVALLPEFRGQGLGERLIRQALEAARAFGLHRVELTVREDNKNAIALYKKIGFEIEGLMRDAMKVDGVYESTYLMSVLFK